MSENRKARQILEARAGVRRRRRLRIKWEDYIGQIMGGKGKTLQEVKRIAKVMDKFRK